MSAPTAREEVLARIRAALGTGAGADAPITRTYRETGEHAAGSDAVVATLVDRLVDYKAIVHQVGSGEEVAATLGELLGSAGSIVVPDGLEEAWLGELGSVTIVRDSRTDARSHDELDHVDGVVTAARVAIAETGTIVLDGEPDQGRRAITLVPDLHVCVLRAEQVVQTVPEAVRLLGAHPDRPQTWISGPSATSDIELSRVEGVHGPRTLHVVVVG
ncbi:MAG: LutC/YkgG family protein [Cellulomonadaceae bacterium]